ncbi:MAG: hypothetical protein KAR54_00740 [Candidatus Pacebacteria bacterium]|nr:hypothetical protein [Candidatus Paceibacterota bacterium]
MFKKITKIVFLITVLSVSIYSTNYTMGSGVNDLGIDMSGQNFDRILFVPGINTYTFDLLRWKRDLKKNFPTKEVIFLDDSVYYYWQDVETEKVVEKGISILNDNKATLVISHSYGGVLATTMIDRAENDNVVKLITMASPHKMDSFGIDNSKEYLGTPDEVDVPTFSFGGYIDPVVIFPNTNNGNSNHQDIWSGHSSFLFNKNVRRKVLEFALGLKYED